MNTGGMVAAMTHAHFPQPGAPSAAWHFDPRGHARSLYWRGGGITQIADEFELHGVKGDTGGKIPRVTIAAWKQRDRWDDAPSIQIEDGCGVDSLVEWTDFNIEAARPYGNRSVWAGYDPQESEDGDNAALVIAAPPLVEGGPFRILERHQLRGLDFEQQAEFIKAMLSRYNCTYLGIDAKGVGAGVYQLLAKVGAMPGCTVAKIEFSLELKTHMVMKAQNVVRRGRLKFDSSFLDIVSAFVSIKKTATSSGRSLTYKAGRGGNDGHADLAWATMHILMNEPLDGKEKPKGTMEIIE